MQAKLDCPACHAKIPTADFKAIFAEDFFDLTTESPIARIRDECSVRTP